MSVKGVNIIAGAADTAKGRSACTLALLQRELSVKMLCRRHGADVLSLAAGEPDFDTPEAILQAGIWALT